MPEANKTLEIAEKIITLQKAIDIIETDRKSGTVDAKLKAVEQLRKTMRQLIEELASIKA